MINNMHIKDLMIYIVAIGIVFIGLYIFFLVLKNARKGSPQDYEDVKGKIIIKGNEDNSGTKVIIGIMKDRSKLAVAVIKNSSGNLCKTTTDIKGNYFFKDVPTGSFWLVATKKGCKASMKLVKIKSGGLNKLSEIVLK